MYPGVLMNHRVLQEESVILFNFVSYFECAYHKYHEQKSSLIFIGLPPVTFYYVPAK